MLKLFVEAVKYAAASAVALGLDAGVLMLLTRYAGWHYLVAGAVSFVTGGVVAYLLSVRFVFSTHRLRDRRVEFVLFLILGMVGLAINTLVLFIVVGRMGLHLLLGKGIAACCSFFASFLLRRQLLFRNGVALA